MSETILLQTIADLSREFGATRYVRGGGGNSSCKTPDTLFIKPSGVTLLEMTPEKFLPLSRSILNELYDKDFPKTESERESAVVAFMTTTILPGRAGRPSVEAPLHNCFPQTFVVHTHPAVVNGMTCGNDGEGICKKLFPDALWMPPVEPGYILSLRVREVLREYEKAHGKPAEILFLANHGVFIAHDTAEGVRALYARVMDALERAVADAGLAGDPPAAPAPGAAEAAAFAAKVRETMGADAAEFAVAGRFAVPAGALSPDHIVYCKTALYEGDGSADSLRAFRAARGYWPRVVAAPAGVFGFGATAKVAALALELAWDAALVVRASGAFGGTKYLDDRLVKFIENWEVESYRQKVVGK